MDTIWIEKSTFLVRRIKIEAQLPRLKIEETIEYSPSMNVEIPEESLIFSPR